MKIHEQLFSAASGWLAALMADRFGALVPTQVGYLGTRMGLGHTIATFASVAYFAMVIATALLPETRGREPQTSE